MGVEPKIGGFYPQIIPCLYNWIFHDFYHPFWGTLIFGNTHIYIDVSKASVKLSLPCVYQMHSFRFGSLHSHQPVTL